MPVTVKSIKARDGVRLEMGHSVHARTMGMRWPAQKLYLQTQGSDLPTAILELNKGLKQ